MLMLMTIRMSMTYIWNCGIESDECGIFSCSDMATKPTLSNAVMPTRKFILIQLCHCVLLINSKITQHKFKLCTVDSMRAQRTENNFLATLAGQLVHEECDHKNHEQRKRVVHMIEQCESLCADRQRNVQVVVHTVSTRVSMYRCLYSYSTHASSI